MGDHFFCVCSFMDLVVGADGPGCVWGVSGTVVWSSSAASGSPKGDWGVFSK